ncbi:MAG: type 1 glutamine amidotransferase [Hyphomicrobiales bacterium]|nr:type 1 glutamine amidotransferase [Hyphomicrobiales bacterium]
MTDVKGVNIMILATDGFEQSELEVPLHTLRDAGATVHVVAPKGGKIRGWDPNGWGEAVAVDRTIGKINHEHYDLLVLPGGQINPDLLRVDEDAVEIVRHFARSGRPIAAICHAPWLLVEADAIKGKTVTCYKSIRKDLANAGAHVEDEAVVVDGTLITSRDPGDLNAFCEAILDMIRDGRPALREARN